MASTLETLLLAQVAYLLNNTPQKIFSTTLGASAATIPVTIPSNTFSAIEVTYSARSDDSNPATYMTLQLNTDTSNDYIWQYNQANNSTVTGSNGGGAVNRILVGTMAAATATANYFGAGKFVIGGPNTGVFKPVTAFSTSGISTSSSYTGVYGGEFASTAVVASMTLQALAGQLIAGTTVTVYGIP